MADPKTYARKLLKPDGAIEDYPPKGKTYTLKELQAAVEGYIEVVSLPDGWHLMVVNEEGKLKGLPHNVNASNLYANPRDYIVGNALVCRSEDID